MNKGAHHSPEARERMAAAKRGKSLTPEHRRKLSEAAKGRVFTEEHRANISRAARRKYENPEEREKTRKSLQGRTHLPLDRNPNWAGDDVGYHGVHLRAKKSLEGLPCAHLDETCKGRLQIAFDHQTPAEYRRLHPQSSCVYSTRVEDYFVLCQSHHRRYDFEFAGAHN